MNEQQPGFVYGLDKQTYDKEFAILVEGPVDANSHRWMCARRQ